MSQAVSLLLFISDEMGLGKTVELLACIFSNRSSASKDFSVSNTMKLTKEQKSGIRRVKKERIECVCGSVTENPRYEGLWVQCDVCDAWQHGDCVNYAPRRKRSKSANCGRLSRESSTKANKRSTTDIVDMDEEFTCQLCSELIQATHAPIPTGATLIVCPGPILSQWRSEINRHTRPGSLKTCVYEGVRDDSTSNASITDINELIGADLVLTTYDVLKADLSHDSDRHEGDRRLLRYHKRYPVVPTMLTRVYWWRICLDEAQMVESSAGAATEMALRLHGKHHWCITGTPIQRRLDDLHGLIRFIRATPFDIPRWWVEVIREPYENGSGGCMQYTHNFFKEIMWRSSKAHVADELQLPPQEEHLSWLSFSAIEEHFYQRQHDTCVGYARDIVESFRNNALKKVNETASGGGLNDHFITHAEAAKLLNSLLKLRQACCHPQVGVSGLRSLQQSPMTMDEILQVLIGKTKVEGEEALRTLVSALNGLAGIAVLRREMHQAVSLYEESLAITKEHSEDFRLDPLMSLHIHHNLAEILRESVLSPEHVQEIGERHIFETTSSAEFDPLESEKSYKGSEVIHDEVRMSSKLITRRLELECEKVKQKFVSAFSSKLSMAQQDFRNLHSQVTAFFKSKDGKAYAVWWLDVLHSIEQTADSSKDLMRKVDDAVSGGIKKSRPSRIVSSFQSITSLKYYIQTGWDSLVASRQSLMDRITEIDKTMEKPRDEDIERVRCCPNCHFNGSGELCIHCELDEVFQVYEARLFRMNKDGGGLITSADEVLDFQKKKTALNHFYWSLAQPNSVSSAIDNEDTRRNIGEKVVVSKSPSDFETILVIIKNWSKAHLGRDGILAATQQLALLENMRKEYSYARALAVAQAQVLRAYDEIKMAISRLRLKESEDDNSIDALSSEQLDEACVQNTHAKILALSSLLRIKGQLRYLKGLMLSKQKIESGSTEDTSVRDELDTALDNPTEKKSNSLIEVDEGTCPICQENLSSRKMVFQCGHITCCKCFFAITEMRVRNGTQPKWVMCPTCRQHTDEGNIAYVDEGKTSPCNFATLNSKECDSSEDSIAVQGSYGTKIEAITRRILWIKSSDPKAKVLVFSSWNDVLDVLQHSLTVNKISYVRMRGGRKSHSAICQFRGRPSIPGKESHFIQVMLILIQHGANGLNLLEAQHVVLVEPLLNPAVEAQAISRVHRIGQQNKTLVHRFIVKGTVEEDILKLNRSRNSSRLCISGNTKNQDQPVLSLKDVESLFALVPPKASDNTANTTDGGLMHLPPSVAAVRAAERRLQVPAP
uniref:E3 ubiquitin-protein ligase SHPRH n=1 Tax=Kalanchoe fedtschenkoi TaxID=63787 RepID=A0A7N0TH89_KALFE